MGRLPEWTRGHPLGQVLHHGQPVLHALEDQFGDTDADVQEGVVVLMAPADNVDGRC